MKQYLCSFKWNGKRKTVFMCMPRPAIREHVKGIRLLDSALLLRYQGHQRAVPVNDIVVELLVVELPDYHWTYCTPKDFLKNWTRA